MVWKSLICTYSCNLFHVKQGVTKGLEFSGAQIERAAFISTNISPLQKSCILGHNPLQEELSSKPPMHQIEFWSIWKQTELAELSSFCNARFSFSCCFANAFLDMATTSLQQNWVWSNGILCQDWQGTHRSAFLHMVIFYILKSQLLLLGKCWHSRNLLTNPRLEFIARPLLPPGCGIRKSQESWHPWMPSRARLSLAICLVFHSHAPQGSVQSGCPSTARTFLHTCKESAIMYQIKRCIHLQHNNVLQEQGFFSGPQRVQYREGKGRRLQGGPHRSSPIGHRG